MSETKLNSTTEATTNTLRDEFAARLRARLKDRNMNQTDLAKRIGMSKDAVSTYARGRSLPSGPKLEEIAAALETTPGELMPHVHEPIMEGAGDPSLRAHNDGTATMWMAVRLPLDVAVQVLNIINENRITDAK